MARLLPSQRRFFERVVEMLGRVRPPAIDPALTSARVDTWADKEYSGGSLWVVLRHRVQPSVGVEVSWAEQVPADEQAAPKDNRAEVSIAVETPWGEASFWFVTWHEVWPSPDAAGSLGDALAREVAEAVEETLVTEWEVYRTLWRGRPSTIAGVTLVTPVEEGRRFRCWLGFPNKEVADSDALAEALSPGPGCLASRFGFFGRRSQSRIERGFALERCGPLSFM